MSAVDVAALRGNAAEAVKVLRDIRKSGVRVPDAVIQLGALVLSDGPALGDEQWTLYEQMVVAALDANDQDTVEICLKALVDKFPDSTRVMRLRGMALEYMGRWTDALRMYDQMLQKNESNAVARKRRISALLGMGEQDKAVAELRTYLHSFPTDTQGWIQLAALCEEAGAFSDACFAYEEVLLAHPLHPTAHVRYAEACYSRGDYASLRAARAHFSQALDLRGAVRLVAPTTAATAAATSGGGAGAGATIAPVDADDDVGSGAAAKGDVALRAAVGLCLTCHALCTGQAPPRERESSAQLHAVGREVIKKIAAATAAAGSAVLAVVDAQAEELRSKSSKE